MPAFSAFTIVDWGCVCVCYHPFLLVVFAVQCLIIEFRWILFSRITDPTSFRTKRNFFFSLPIRQLVNFTIFRPENWSHMAYDTLIYHWCHQTKMFSLSSLSLRLVCHVFVLVHRMPLSLPHNSSVSVAIEAHNVQKTHSTSYDTIVSCGQKTSSTINDINIMPSLLVAVSIYLFAYYYLHYLAPANGEGQLYCLFAIWL